MKIMKAKKNELDVDYIGGEVPLTPNEEKALSEYFQKKKAARQLDQKTAKPKKNKSSTLVES